MNIFEILEGLISSVPEAITLYHKIVPLISPNADVSDAQIAEINEIAPQVHAAVQVAHDAIAALIDTHTTTTVSPPAA